MPHILPSLESRQREAILQPQVIVQRVDNVLHAIQPEVADETDGHDHERAQNSVLVQRGSDERCGADTQPHHQQRPSTNDGVVQGR